MKNFKKNNGITLIALVVTIIVLLILAAVSLRLVAGSDGLLNKASKAVDATEIASAKERAELFLAKTISEYYEEKYIKLHDVGTKLDFIQTKVGDGIQLDADYYLKLSTIATSKITNSIKVASLENAYTIIEGATELKIEIFKGTSADDLKIIDGIINSDGKVEWNEEVTQNQTPTPTPDPEPVTYTVTFYDSDKATVLSSKTVEENTSIGSGNMPTNPTKEADASYTYEFAGWKKVSDDSEFTASTSVTASIGVYAEYTQTPIISGTPVLQAITDATHYGDYFDLSTEILGTVTNNVYSSSITLEGESTTIKSDWRIFNRDDDGVWLILADYLPVNGSDMNTFITGTGINQIGLVTKTGDDLNSYKYSVWSNTNRADLLDRLALNSTLRNKWKGLLPSSLQSEDDIEVVGALTVSQWKDSWDKEYPSDAMSITGNETNGYSTENLSSKTGYSNTLYFPHKSAQSNCWGYWLASPNANDSLRVMYVYYGGNVDGGYYFYDNYGVRPAVRLGSSINIEQDEDTGIWTIAE